MAVVGIYSITNRTNEKRYIGSSNNVSHRLASHRINLRNGTHQNPHLQGAWNLDGEENFLFSVLEVLEDEQDLLTKEKFWIDFYIESLYNICLNPEFRNAGVSRSENFKLNASIKMKEVWNKRRLGIDTKREINNREKKYAHKVFPGTFISPDGVLYHNVENLTEFSKKNNLNPARMFELYYSKKQKSHKGWTFTKNFQGDN